MPLFSVSLQRLYKPKPRTLSSSDPPHRSVNMHIILKATDFCTDLPLPVHPASRWHPLPTFHPSRAHTGTRSSTASRAAMTPRTHGRTPSRDRKCMSRASTACPPSPPLPCLLSPRPILALLLLLCLCFSTASMPHTEFETPSPPSGTNLSPEHDLSSEHERSEDFLCDGGATTLASSMVEDD